MSCVSQFHTDSSFCSASILKKIFSWDVCCISKCLFPSSRHMKLHSGIKPFACTVKFDNFANNSFLIYLFIEPQKLRFIAFKGIHPFRN